MNEVYNNYLLVIKLKIEIIIILRYVIIYLNKYIKIS